MKTEEEATGHEIQTASRGRGKKKTTHTHTKPTKNKKHFDDYEKKVNRVLMWTS